MKKFIFTFVICLISICLTDNVYALSGKLSVTSNVNSVAINTKFQVYVKYTGDTLGSLTMQVNFSNAKCNLSEQAEGYSRKCTDTGCKLKFEDYETGYKSGTTFAKFSCTGTASPAKITAAIVGGDSWGGLDADGHPTGEEPVSVSGGSKSITITNATTQAVVKTTTTTKKTTKKTTTKSTTKKTTSKTTVGTTTKKSTTTTIKSTTKPTTSTKKKTTTTEPITTNIAHINDDMKLDKLKVVGYDIDFEKNLTGYKIYVDDKIDEVYVIAEAVDKSKKVVNTGVVNIEGLSHFSVHVYNEKTDQTVSYTVKIMREKSSLAEVLYTKFYKPSVALAAIILTLIILGISLYKSGTFVKVEKLPTIASEDVTYDGSKFVSNNMIDDDVIDDEELDDMLEDVGIQELEEGGEEKLVTVLMDMNKKNDD